MSTKTKEKTLALKLALEIQIEHNWEVDESPWLDWLGKYTDQWEEGAIDRQKRGDMKNTGEYRYFVSGNHAVFEKSDWSHVRGKVRQGVIKKYGSLEKATRRYALEDYKRMEAMNNDEWHMRVLSVTVKLGSLSATQHLSGIESDCGEEHEERTIMELASEGLHELREKVTKRLKVE